MPKLNKDQQAVVDYGVIVLIVKGERVGYIDNVFSLVVSGFGIGVPAFIKGIADGEFHRISFPASAVFLLLYQITVRIAMQKQLQFSFPSDIMKKNTAKEPNQ